MKKEPTTILLLLSMILIPLLIASTAKPERKSSKAAPPWAATDLDGKPVNSSDYAGKVVILDLWATWCPPCRDEIPGFIELQKQYGKDGLVIVGASVDTGGMAAVKSFTKKLGINYPIILAPEKMQAAFGGIEAIPTTFIIDRQGNIAGKHVGFASKSAFESEIKPLLAAKK